MSQITKTTKTTTCMLFFLISFYILLSSVDQRAIYSSGCYGSILPLIGVFLVAVLIVFAVRTTIVAWITVLVLLAFAGKRRKVLVREGREITSDVAMYLVQVVVKERSLVAFACATVVSLIAMVWLRMANQTSL